MPHTPTRLSRAQVREVDHRAIADYHVPGVVLMENAARGAADVACDMLDRKKGSSITIVCGGGNNGGDGLAVARHLFNRGHNVQILLAIDPQKYTGDALVNWQIVQAMGLEVEGADAAPELLSPFGRDLIIDALFGTGLSQPPRPDARAVIERMNAAQVPILAIDLPSGLDCDTGQPLENAVRATRTATFVTEKAGFAHPDAHEYTGEITVADIGCPKQLIEEVAAAAP